MKILIEKEVAVKLRYYTDYAPGEVSGFCKSHKTEDGDILITDIILLDQECSHTSTELDYGAVAKFRHELVQNGGDPKEWDVWWHTHADFGVFWSGTDDANIEGFKDDHSHFISIVTNKDGDFKGRLDVYPKDTSGYGFNYASDKNDLDVEILISEEDKKAVEKKIEDIAELVAEAEEYIEKRKEDVVNIKNELVEDKDIAVECEKEVKEKVRKYVYVAPAKGNQWNKKTTFVDDGKFEGAMKNIYNGVEVNGYLDAIDPYTTMCPECSENIAFCICEDALWKYGEEGLLDQKHADKLEEEAMIEIEEVGNQDDLFLEEHGWRKGDNKNNKK